MQSGSRTTIRFGGFTVVECLVSIGVIFVLVGVLFPTFLRIRTSAVESVSSARIRQHTVMFASYAADFDHAYPVPISPKAGVGVVVVEGRHVEFHYFDALNIWNLFLAQRYYELPVRHEVFHPPGRRKLESSYYYSSSFLADPQFWDYETRTGPRQWRATRTHEVSYPSLKGMFYPSDTGDLFYTGPEGRLIGFCDTSVRRIHGDEFLPFYAFGTGNWPGSRIGVGVPVLHTMHGVRGRDVR